MKFTYIFTYILISTGFLCGYERHRPNSISGSPIYFPVKNPGPTHSCVPVHLYWNSLVFVNVTGRMCPTGHRYIYQWKTCYRPPLFVCGNFIIQHLQEMYTNFYCSTYRYDDVCMTSQWRRIWGIRWNKSGGTCWLEIVVWRAVRPKTRTHLGFPLVCRRKTGCT